MKLSRIIGLAVAAFCIIAIFAAAVIVADTRGPVEPGGKNNEFVNDPSTGTQKNTQSLPPDEAISSCTGKSTGDVCQFKDRQGTSTGVCDNTPGVLACAPVKKQNTGQTPDEKSAPQAMGTPSGNLQSGNAPSGNVQSNSKPSGNSQSDSVQSGSVQSGNVQSGPVTTVADKGSFLLTSDAGADGSTMSVEYTCDGTASSPALSWSGAPSGTKEFALMITTLPVDGATRWNWVLYGIPGITTSLVKDSSAVGTVGTGSHGTVMTYDPPCPQGPGAKIYTITVYALSASPTLPGSPEQVTGEVLTDAISSITLGKASLDLSYARP